MSKRLLFSTVITHSVENGSELALKTQLGSTSDIFCHSKTQELMVLQSYSDWELRMELSNS